MKKIISPRTVDQTFSFAHLDDNTHDHGKHSSLQERPSSESSERILIPEA